MPTDDIHDPFYTTLGQLSPRESGIDSEGDTMTLATDMRSGLPVVLLITPGGEFKVYPMTDVPMTHAVAKAEIAVGVRRIEKSEAEANVRIRALINLDDDLDDGDDDDDDDVTCPDELADREELGEQLAEARG